MTKKDYIALANMVKARRASFKCSKSSDYKSAVSDFEIDLIDILRVDNPRFDIEKWNAFVKTKN